MAFKKTIIIFLLICSVVYGQNNPYRILNSFNAGELSPLLNAREDLAKYQNGCSIMENLIPLPQGGVQKRPGTKYIAEVKTSSLATRLLPFEFSTTQSYVIEAGNQYFRFYTSGAQIKRGSGTEDLSGVDSDDLMAHWLLNETEGLVAVNADNAGTYDADLLDSADGATDISTVTADGKVGAGCFNLGGLYTAVAVDAEAADAVSFSFTDNANDDPCGFSIACWAYVTQGSDVQNLVSKWIDDGTTSEWRFSMTNERKLQLHLADTSNDLASDIVAQWKLNETGPSATLDNAENNADHDLTATDTADNFTATSKHANLGTCLDFKGSISAATTTDSTSFFFDDSGDNPFSISAWIYVIDSSTQMILSKYDRTTDAQKREWRLYLNSSEKLVLDLYDESVDATASLATDNALSTGWHHVVATYDSEGGSAAVSNSHAILYVDNTAVAQTASYSGTYAAMEDLDGFIYLGAGEGTGGAAEYQFADKLDNVIVFDTDLSAAEVSILYNDSSGLETLDDAIPTPFAVTDDAISVGWHFLTCTYSAPADETTAADGIILYVDGASVNVTATNDADYTAMQDGEEELRIGSQRNTGDTANESFWADKIDEVSIFDDVLTPTEVAGLYTEAAYEITTPYLTADLFDLKYEQSADVLYIVHSDYETRKLSRLNNTLWTLTAISINDGPFRTENSDVADFLTASATTGSVTLTATGHSPFIMGSTAGHEPSGTDTTDKAQTGALFKIVHPAGTLEYNLLCTDSYDDDSTEDVSWVHCGTLYEGAEWTLTTKDEWQGTVEVQRNYTIGAAKGHAGWETVLSFTSGTTDQRNVSTTGTEDDDDADYRVRLANATDDTCQIHFSTDQTEVVGIVEITSVTSATSALGTVIKTLASINATHKWSEGSWSNYRGWPQTTTFFEDRLCFGGNTAQPDTIWGSVTSDYENMTAGVNDDDAILFTLSSRQVNVIEWLVGKDKLLIGTSGAEWTIAGGTDEPLTSSNAIVKQHSTYGSANLQANLANESVLFFQRGKEKMRELAYNWELDSYVAPDMTILANFVTNGGIVDTDFQKTPDSILWTVRNDGQLPVFSYERKENVTAWSRMITSDGTSESDFESVVVINGDPEDEVWAIVERTIDSSTPNVRYIEQFQPRNFGTDADDAYYVDCGITYDDVASSAMVGLDHLEGETVYVLADGEVFDTEVVSGGAITLSSGGTTKTASTVQMGLPITVQMRTMPLSWVAQGMTIQGKTKRISEVVANWYKSGDFSIGKNSSTLQTYTITGQTTNQDRITFPPGYSREGYVFVWQKSAEPLTLLAVALEFNVN